MSPVTQTQSQLADLDAFQKKKSAKKPQIQAQLTDQYNSELTTDAQIVTPVRSQPKKQSKEAQAIKQKQYTLGQSQIEEVDEQHKSRAKSSNNEQNAKQQQQYQAPSQEQHLATPQQ